MSGPDVPPPPVGGANALGKFTIGVSPIGTLSPWYVWKTIISQYANSDVLTTLITNFDSYIDPTKNLENFFDFIWNVDTAQGYGLDVWGRIVGVGRNLQLPGALRFFGFEEMGTITGADPFNVSPFYTGQTLTQTFRLSDLAYRKLVLAKALSNISDGSIPSINQLLINLFGAEGRGNCYVTDGHQVAPYFGFVESTTAEPFNQAPFYNGGLSSRMTMTYTFNFQLTPVELAIVEQSNVLPKPTGVKAAVVQNY